MLCFCWCFIIVSSKCVALCLTCMRNWHLSFIYKVFLLMLLLMMLLPPPLLLWGSRSHCMDYTYMHSLQHIVSQVLTLFSFQPNTFGELHAIHFCFAVAKISVLILFCYIQRCRVLALICLDLAGGGDGDELLSTTHKPWVLSSYDSITICIWKTCTAAHFLNFHNLFALHEHTEMKSWNGDNS